MQITSGFYQYLFRIPGFIVVVGTTTMIFLTLLQTKISAQSPGEKGGRAVELVTASGMIRRLVL